MPDPRRSDKADQGRAGGGLPAAAGDAAAPPSDGRGRDASTSAYTTNARVSAIHRPSSIWIARVVPAASLDP